MAVLIPKTDRLGLGLNTLTRNIVFSILALRGLTRAVPAYKDFINIAFSQTGDDDSIDLTFNASVKLLVQPEAVGAEGFNRLDYIKNLSELTPDNPPALVAVNGVNPLPDNPEGLTLEKFIYWAGIVLGCSTYPSTDYYKEVFEDKPASGDPYVTLDFVIPLDYRRYLLRQNAIAASIQPFTVYVTDPGSLPSTPWVIPPNTLFWGEPVATLTALRGLTGQTLGVTRWVESKQALYTLVASGDPDDDDLWVEPTTQTGTEIWKKGGTGSGNGSTQTPEQIRDALATLTGTNRLDATAIKNLPDTGTPGADGADGKNPEFQFSETHLQYRLIGDTAWIDLIPKNAITGPTGGTGATGSTGADGKNPEFQFSETHLQYRLVGDPAWIDLIPKNAITGPTGVTGSVSSASSLTLEQIVTPAAPSAGNTLIYSKSDGKIYKRAAGGDEEAIGGAVAQWVTTAVKTGNYTANNLERIPCNTSGGGFAITTPATGKFQVIDVIGNSPTTGFGATSKNLTITPASGTVMGGASLVLNTGAISPEFELIGTDWRIVNHG